MIESEKQNLESRPFIFWPTNHTCHRSKSNFENEPSSSTKAKYFDNAVVVTQEWNFIWSKWTMILSDCWSSERNNTHTQRNHLIGRSWIWRDSSIRTIGNSNFDDWPRKSDPMNSLWHMLHMHFFDDISRYSSMCWCSTKNRSADDRSRGIISNDGPNKNALRSQSTISISCHGTEKSHMSEDEMQATDSVWLLCFLWILLTMKSKMRHNTSDISLSLLFLMIDGNSSNVAQILEHWFQVKKFRHTVRKEMIKTLLVQRLVKWKTQKKKSHSSVEWDR